MKEKKVYETIAIILSVLLVYSLSVNLKYSSNLMSMFIEETSNLRVNNDGVNNINKIINKEVNNDEKNEILREEQENKTKLMLWFFHLDKYTLASEETKNLSIDVAEKILDISEKINELKKKEISKFTDEDRTFLNYYKNIVEVSTKNSRYIVTNTHEAVIMPLYTRKHLEKNINEISDSILK